MKVLIATPTAGNIVTTAYAHTLVTATRVLNAAGWDYQHRIFDGADVVMARNFLAHQAMADPRYTHLLFLDSDIAVPEAVLRRLVKANRPVSGAIYSERSLDRKRYADLLASGVAEPRARAAASRFTVRLIDGKVAVKNGWCRLAGIGAGCLLIRREVLAALIEHGAAPRIESARLKTVVGVDHLHDFFGQLPLKDGDYLSEDYSFCERARAAGFEIWGIADLPIAHVGAADFSARYVDFLEQVATGKTPT